MESHEAWINRNEQIRVLVCRSRWEVEKVKRPSRWVDTIWFSASIEFPKNVLPTSRLKYNTWNIVLIVRLLRQPTQFFHKGIVFLQLERCEMGVNLLLRLNFYNLFGLDELKWNMLIMGNHCIHYISGVVTLGSLSSKIKLLEKVMASIIEAHRYSPSQYPYAKKFCASESQVQKHARGTATLCRFCIPCSD